MSKKTIPHELEQLPVEQEVTTKTKVIKIHPGSAPTSGFKVGSHFAFDESLAPITVEGHGLAPIQCPAEPTLAHRFSIGLTIDDKGVMLPLGLTVISGATAAGKSSFVRQLISKAKKFDRVIATEPYDSLEEIDQVPAFETADGALAYAIRRQIEDPQSLTFIDSLRAPVFETSGAAGSKGVIMPFFTQLTRVSNSLARQGRTVVALVNPMDDNDEYVTAFLSKLSSALPAYVYLKKVTGEGEHAVFEGEVTVRSSGNHYHRQARHFITTGVSKAGAIAARSTSAKFPETKETTLSLADRTISSLTK